MISKVINFICGTVLCMCISVFMIVCIMTPEKTNKGYYTNPYKYWTSDEYLCDNFNFNPNYCKGINQ